MLKRTLAGVVVAGLLLGAGAVNAAGSVFPNASDDGGSLPALSTFADRHRGDPMQSSESPFPNVSDDGGSGLPALSTYANRYRGIQRAGIDASPGAGESVFQSSTD